MNTGRQGSVPNTKLPNPTTWWQTGIIYEIYLRSFQDTTGNGIGDINGVRKRLDYLKWLGIDILWMTPPYKSPQVEFGYDTADYLAIDPVSGTLADFEALLMEAHQRDMRVVLDIAPNHTSDQHEWFQDSRSSRDSRHRDWYIWKDAGPDGGPPNNWVSAFGGGSAWELDPATGQYYYHAFLKEQPDLNWQNPEVAKAIFNCFRFWLDKGVDGFRIDVMWHLVKDTRFRDNPPNPNFDPKTEPSNNVLQEVYSADRPEVIDLVVRMRDVLKEYEGDRLMIGELYQSGARLVDFYGPDGRGAQLPHNQQLLLQPWDAPKIRDAAEKYLGSLPDDFWPNWVLSNHDKPRIATRSGSQAQARVAMMLLLTLRGTPTMYYGDELGMENAEILPDELRDPFEKLDPGKGQGRDPQRTPMQWNADSNAGFTTGKPWLPVADNSQQLNMETLKNDPASMLNFTKRLIELRRKQPALSMGDHRLVITDVQGPVIAYSREYESEKFLIALNLSSTPATFPLPTGCNQATVILSTLEQDTSPTHDKQVSLRGNEGLILKCD